MMKITLFALAVFAVTFAQDDPPAGGESAPVQIVKQIDEVDVDKYNFEFETSDGTSRQETGEYKNDTEQEGLVVRGSYKYIAPDGQEISVTYLADKNGYQPNIENAAGQDAPAPQDVPAPQAPPTPEAAPAPEAPEEAEPTLQA
ncbi:hypothetical protein PYW08_014814 [Mythimna loreyi]|uniref:Uncharacterized protein n=1 Tax=Mythimna loreyi TaxID=667449 RepID=A0ACC2R3L7_9NEOP|nr:hypothetical protein PYW08_014814 [Mythimna loreyi]